MATGDARRRVDVDETTLELLDPRPLATRHKAGLVGLAVLVVLPFLVGQITIRRLTGALFVGMFAMSWDVVSGYTGEISFGHAFFFALGGYGSAVLAISLGWSPLVTIPVGVLVAAAGGVVIGVPALRISGPYLSLVTLVAPLLLFQVFVIYSDVFGGETGLRNPAQLIGTRDSAVVTVASSGDARLLNYYLALVVMLVILAVCYAVTRSNAGAVFYAIRAGEDVVAATGKDPAKFKIFAFVLSAAVGGLAGAVFVHTNVGSPTPSQILALEVSLIVIIASVLGGMGTVVGALVGGLFVQLLEFTVLNQIDVVVPVVDRSISEMSFMLVGVVGLAIIYLLPGGMLRWAIEKGEELERHETYRDVRDRLDDLTGGRL